MNPKEITTVDTVILNMRIILRGYPTLYKDDLEALSTQIEALLSEHQLQANEDIIEYEK